MWDWPPLVVNEASHDMIGGGVEKAPPAMHHTNHGPKNAISVSARWYKWRGGEPFALYLRPFLVNS
jgi:hypothetical protein